MNLETKINEDLWREVRRSYSEKRYTDAIKDAILHLSDVIRTKSGVEGDGASLVGQAFGGNDPKIRVSKLESLSDRDMQAGFEAMLRGIYQGLRNPRHHGKVNDTVDDAEAVILFIDYLIGIIGRSKSQFSMDDCLNTIFDDAFVETSQYAKLLVSEIPAKYRRDVFIEAFQRIERGSPNKFRYFFHALLDSLTPAELEDARAIISKALRTANPKDGYISILATIRPTDWGNLDPIARLRAESVIIESLRDGEYVKATDTLKSGALATWASNFLQHFDSRENVFYILRAHLVSTRQHIRSYVQEFMPALSVLRPNPTVQDVNILKEALQKGYSEVHEQLSMHAAFEDATHPWVAPFVEAMKQFTPRIDTPVLEDDVPF